MREEEKGSALIIAILVVLVLTMVGLASMFYMTMEDRLAATDMLSKTAFYAAETGLRRGEEVIKLLPSTQLDSVLGYTDTKYNDPTTIANLTASDLYGTAHLGAALRSTYAGTSTALVLQEPTGFAPTGRVRLYYSLYVRNNPNDHQASDTSYLKDHDTAINLISRGLVSDMNGLTMDSAGNIQGRILFEKVLCEQLLYGTAAAQTTQLRFNQGGLGSSLY